VQCLCSSWTLWTTRIINSFITVASPWFTCIANVHRHQLRDQVGSWKPLETVCSQLAFTSVFVWLHKSECVRICKVSDVNILQTEHHTSPLQNIVTNSQVLFHDGSLLHSKFNTQSLIKIRNASRILRHVQLLLVLWHKMLITLRTHRVRAISLRSSLQLTIDCHPSYYYNRSIVTSSV
jgi:hypothetical protein